MGQREGGRDVKEGREGGRDFKEGSKSCSEGEREGGREGRREVGEEEVKEWETGSDHERGGEKDRRRERTVRCGE